MTCHLTSIEWPEVVTEGKTLEDCRIILRDALQEMVKAYKKQHKVVKIK
jgi:predicted RNase H-like HicB family nuclease